ncbi:MAG: hypothetical protein ACREOI_27125 [bacterium]
MKKEYSMTNGRNKTAARRKATELLDWIIDFLPVAIPKTLERAILDESGEVHALFWHRSELQHILEKEPTALEEFQREKLANVDKRIRTSALLLLGAEKGTLQNYREGRYDHSHWWWYLDDLLQEELMAKRRAKRNVSYPLVSEVNERLLKVAEPRAAYGRRTNVRKKESK